MAKIYYNDNGTWKVVDVPGGGSGGGGSIDADTLNGLLSAGDGISIGKTTAGDKVEVKVDPSANIVGTTFEARDNPTSPVEYTKLRYTGVFEYHNPMFNYTFSLPATGDSGIYQLLASNYVKTLFGNQSIVGAGNIDLYRHHILCSTPNEGIKVLITVISSKNLKVDSLTDLKTLLGNTFECPCTGYAMAQGKSLVICNENGFLPIDVWVNVVDPTPDVTWSNIESIVDTVTTI